MTRKVLIGSGVLLGAIAFSQLPEKTVFVPCHVLEVGEQITCKFGRNRPITQSCDSIDKVEEDEILCRSDRNYLFFRVDWKAEEAEKPERVDRNFDYFNNDFRK